MHYSAIKGSNFVNTALTVPRQHHHKLYIHIYITVMSHLVLMLLSEQCVEILVKYRISIHNRRVTRYSHQRLGKSIWYNLKICQGFVWYYWLYLHSYVNDLICHAYSSESPQSHSINYYEPKMVCECVCMCVCMFVCKAIWDIIGLGIFLLPVRPQAITWINVELMTIKPLCLNCSEMWTRIKIKSVYLEVWSW